MALQVVKAKPRTPPLRCILFGPVGSWKTSTYAHAQKALWIDLHGSTAVLTTQPDCAFEPLKGDRPENFPAYIDMLRDVSQMRGEYDSVITDGLDDVYRHYIIPEALRMTKCSTLGENYGKPMDAVVSLTHQVVAAYEALYSNGFNVLFTAHDQLIERINPEGVNFMVTELDAPYQAGKVGKWDCPSLWRDWVDVCAYLTVEGRSVVKREGDKLAKATGDADARHVAYLRIEAWLDSAKGRRLERVKSPLSIGSPRDLWEAIYGGWRNSFDPSALKTEAQSHLGRLPEEQQTKLRAYLDAPGRTAEELLAVLRTLTK